MNLIGGHTIACTLNARFAAHLPRCGVLSLGITRKPSGAADAGCWAFWRVARTIVYWGCWKEVARWLLDTRERVLCWLMAGWGDGSRSGLRSPARTSRVQLVGVGEVCKFTPDLYKQDPPFSC